MSVKLLGGVAMTAAALWVIVSMTGCQTPAATSKDQDPGSVEVSHAADGTCVIRTPGLSPRQIDATCEGGVHTKPDAQYGSNWLQWGMALLTTAKAVGVIP